MAKVRADFGRVDPFWSWPTCDKNRLPAAHRAFFEATDKWVLWSLGEVRWEAVHAVARELREADSSLPTPPCNLAQLSESEDDQLRRAGTDLLGWTAGAQLAWVGLQILEEHPHLHADIRRSVVRASGTALVGVAPMHWSTSLPLVHDTLLAKGSEIAQSVEAKGQADFVRACFPLTARRASNLLSLNQPTIFAAVDWLNVIAIGAQSPPDERDALRPTS